MEFHYGNEHIYAVGDDDSRPNYHERPETTSTQNDKAAISKINRKLRIMFLVMVVFFIVTLAAFGVQFHWISRLNIPNIEQKDQQLINVPLVQEWKNMTRASQGNLIKMMKDFAKVVGRCPGMCYEGTGVVNPSQLSASSTHESCRLQFANLNSASAWCAEENEGNPWIQVDYVIPRTVNAILTQGREYMEQWVTAYQVSYGNDTSEMQYYEELEKVKIFIGNYDSRTITCHRLFPRIHARYVRIYPVWFYRHMSMRFAMGYC